MKILKRLEQIEKNAQVARDDGSLREDLGKVERATDKVVALTGSLERIAVAFRELQTVSPDRCSALAVSLQLAANNLTTLGDHVRTTPQHGASPAFAQQFMTSEKAVRTVEQSLAEAWASHRELNRKPSVDRGLLETFGRAGLRVDHLLEQYDDAKRNLENVDLLSLPHEGTVDRFHASLKSLDEVSEGLTDIVPAPIAGFFRQADTLQGAPLSALTDEVRSFLAEHRIAERYSIRGRG